MLNAIGIIVTVSNDLSYTYNISILYSMYSIEFTCCRVTAIGAVNPYAALIQNTMKAYEEITTHLHRYIYIYIYICNTYLYVDTLYFTGSMELLSKLTSCELVVGNSDLILISDILFSFKYIYTYIYWYIYNIHIIHME